MLHLPFSVATLFLLPSVTRAANDWSKPCLQGICSYDIPQSSSTVGGTLLISGASHAISDITPVAGWDILNCSSDSASQTIRIVCTGDDASCDHLHQNGAKDTLVRLPENCGKGPFARVSDMIMADDQTVPLSIASKLAKRGGGPVQVMTVGLDTNFSTSAHGPVSFKVVGSNIPGALDKIKLSPPSRKRKMDKRGILGDMKSALDTFNEFSLNSFNKSKSINLPINIDEDFPVFSQNISCPSTVDAGLEVDIDTKLNAQVTVGVVAQGKFFPPHVSEFAMVAALTADLIGTLNIDANVAGSIDTGSIPLFSLGLPGLDIEGIFSLGPTLNLNAEAKATVALDVDLSVDLAYSVNSLNFVFPPSQGSSSSDVSPNDSPLRLSVSPNVSANATIEAHLIPSLNFGLSIGGDVGASIFLDLDASATLDLGLSTGATESIDSNGDSEGSADVTGCVDLKGGIAANVGAKGTFFDIFDDETQFSLFSKDFELFQKCFSDATPTQNNTPVEAATAVPSSQTAAASAPRRENRGLQSRAALTCASPGAGFSQVLVDELLDSSSFNSI